jgi:hypothetical protein
MAGPIQQKASPSQASRTFARPTGNLSTAGLPTRQDVDALVRAEQRSERVGAKVSALIDG